MPHKNDQRDILPHEGKHRRERAPVPEPRDRVHSPSFSRVSVDGQDDVTAPDEEAGVELVAGTDMVITTAGDSVEFECVPTIPPIPNSLNDLDDVDTVTNPPGSGDTLTYNGAGEWEPVTPVQQINDLSDVGSASVPTLDDFLRWDGGEWVNQDLGPLGGHDDVVSTPGTNGYVLTWDGPNGWWEPSPIPMQTVNLTDTRDAVSATVESSAGTDATIDAATSSLAGVMTAADKTKLDGLGQGKEDLMTGVITGGVISANAGDPSKYDLSEGTGITVDWTDPANPVVTDVSWAAVVAGTVPDLATDAFTSVHITSAGTVVLTASFLPGPEEKRQHIQLGLLVHTDLTEIESTSQAIPAYEASKAVLDWIAAVGAINAGNQYSANVAGNLTIDKAVGVTTLPFINRNINAQNPTMMDNAALAPVPSLNGGFRDGAGGHNASLPATTIDPDVYDDGSGVLATVPNNRWTIKRLYFLGDVGITYVSVGQVVYSKLADAEAAIFSEDPDIDPRVEGFSVLITALIVKKGATDLTSPTQAKFVKITQATSSGSAPSSSVLSVFGRTGAVLAAASDYDASEVDNDSGVAGAQVSDALDTLDTELGAVPSTYTKKAGVFMARKTVLQTTTTGLVVLSNWAAADSEDPAYSWDASGGILTFNEDWAGFINLNLYGVLSVSGRCELYAECQEDTGAGYVQVSGCQAANYAARQTTENEGGLAIPMFWHQADSGNKLRFVVRHATTAFRVKGFWSMWQTS